MRVCHSCGKADKCEWNCQRKLWLGQGHADADKDKRCSKCGISFKAWFNIMTPISCSAVMSINIDRPRSPYSY